MHPVKSLDDLPEYVIISSPILTEPEDEKEEASVKVIVVALSVISPLSVVVAPGTVTEVNVTYSPL